MTGIVAVCSFVACLSTNIVATVGEESITVAGIAKGLYELLKDCFWE